MAKFCTNCGKEIPEEAVFCTECGTPAPVGAAAPQSAAQAPQPEPVYQPAPEPAPPVHRAQPYAPCYAPPAGEEDAPPRGGKYEPLSTGGFIGSMILMAIPVVGWAVAIIWACGGCRQVNKRNLARATLVLLVIGLVLCAICYFAGRALWNGFLESSGLAEQFGELTGQFGDLGELSEMLEQFKELQEMQLPVTP